MNILVCVKQVPNTNEIKIDPETNTLIRKGVGSILNTYDGYALEAAARLKDNVPDTRIVVLSMGPNQAEDALRECLAIAADAAYLATDRLFAGSDTLATSYILSKCITKIEALESITFDAIFCGKQAIDGDTAQTGPAIAELLDIPQITRALTCEHSGDGLHVLRETDNGMERAGIGFPCLVTFTKPNFDPRFPTVKRRLAAKKAEISHISAENIADMDIGRIGLKGSPTKVKKTYVMPMKNTGIIIKEETSAQAAAKLVELLSKQGVV